MAGWRVSSEVDIASRRSYEHYIRELHAESDARRVCRQGQQMQPRVCEQMGACLRRPGVPTLSWTRGLHATWPVPSNTQVNIQTACCLQSLTVVVLGY